MTTEETAENNDQPLAVKAKQSKTSAQVIVAALGVPEFIAEKINSECSEDLKAKIVDAYEKRESSEVIRGLVSIRKVAEDSGAEGNQTG